MVKKIILVLFLFVGLILFVTAEDNNSGWDQFSDGDIEQNSSGESAAPTVSEEVDNSSNVGQTVPKENVANSYNNQNYTKNFYDALWVSLGAILLLILFFYLFFRRPNNRWRRKYS